METERIVSAAVGFAGGNILARLVGLNPTIGGVIGGAAGYALAPKIFPSLALPSSPLARAYIEENIKRAEAGMEPLPPEAVKIPPTGGDVPLAM